MTLEDEEVLRSQIASLRREVDDARERVEEYVEHGAIAFAKGLPHNPNLLLELVAAVNEWLAKRGLLAVEEFALDKLMEKKRLDELIAKRKRD